MQDELECEGTIRFGNLPWPVSERLAQFAGNWLAYAPEENAVVARRPEPVGCPALSGVPCELISMIDLVPSDQRERMPGGAISIKDRSGRILTLLVERGELRIQWPRQQPRGTVVKGWARFAGAPARAKDLHAFADRFHGLFPESELPSECQQHLLYVEFKEEPVLEDELLNMMAELADPPESLQAELEFRSPGAEGVRFRIRDGVAEKSRVSETD